MFSHVIDSIIGQSYSSFAKYEAAIYEAIKASSHSLSIASKKPNVTTLAALFSVIVMSRRRYKPLLHLQKGEFVGVVVQSPSQENRKHKNVEEQPGDLAAGKA
jgi:hypothetical protein